MVLKSTQPPPESASPAATESGIIAATSSPATSKTGDMKSSPKTDAMDSSGRSAQEKSANTLKLNQLPSKYGTKPVSLGEERDEQHTETEMEVDDGNRETVEEQQPNFIDTKKLSKTRTRSFLAKLKRKKTTKSFDANATSTESVKQLMAVGNTVASHEDDDGCAFVYHCAPVVEAFNPRNCLQLSRNWLKLFSHGIQSLDAVQCCDCGYLQDEGETINGSEAKSLGESTHMTHLSKKSTVAFVKHDAPDGIEVYHHNRKNLLKPAKFEDDGPIKHILIDASASAEVMTAYSTKKQYEEEIVPQRNCLTHAFINCDDFFTGLFCCQENVETKLQKSEAEEWNECYRYCEKFLHQDNDNFVEGEAFIAWLNILEEQATTEEKSLSKSRVDKLNSLLIPVATEQRRQYEELGVALDNAMMRDIYGVEHLDYAIKKAAVAEFNKNCYRIMLKGENHGMVVQQVARIIEDLGFERSLPPPPPTRAEKRAEWLQENVHSPIDSFIVAVDSQLVETGKNLPAPVQDFINDLKESELEIYKSDTEISFRLDKPDEDCSTAYTALS